MNFENLITSIILVQNLILIIIYSIICMIFIKVGSARIKKNSDWFSNLFLKKKLFFLCYDDKQFTASKTYLGGWMFQPEG